MDFLIRFFYSQRRRCSFFGTQETSSLWRYASWFVEIEGLRDSPALKRQALHRGEVPFLVDLGDVTDQAPGIFLVRVQDHTVSATRLYEFPMFHNIDRV